MDNIKTKASRCPERLAFSRMTRNAIAAADAIMNGGKADDFINAYKKWRRLYPDAGYGGRFGSWIYSDDRKPYNSWGNGSAMRVSPCAWLINCGFYGHTGCWLSNLEKK